MPNASNGQGGPQYSAEQVQDLRRRLRERDAELDAERAAHARTLAALAESVALLREAKRPGECVYAAINKLADALSAARIEVRP